MSQDQNNLRMTYETITLLRNELMGLGRSELSADVLVVWVWRARSLWGSHRRAGGAFLPVDLRGIRCPFLYGFEGEAGMFVGGGIDIGKGAIVEAEAGTLYKVASHADLVLGASMTRSISGGLEMPMLHIGLAYRFEILGSRCSFY